MSRDSRPNGFDSDPIAQNYCRYLLPTVFEPWAHHLVATVSPTLGTTVLDIASGTGAVARAASRATGPTGRVIATDISAAMLGEISSGGTEPASARIETIVAAATALPLEDASVDVVLCQHGLPFVQDKSGAMSEMKRVLRSQGRLGIVVWAAQMRLEPFDSYGEVLRDETVQEPFRRAWDFNSVKMSRARVLELLAGFADVTVEAVSLRLDWPSIDDAVNGIFGTPYGPALCALAQERRDHVITVLRDWMTASPHPLVTAFVATART